MTRSESNPSPRGSLWDESRIQDSSVLRKDDASHLVLCSAIGQNMTLEWFNALLGAMFVGVWLLVGQIIATERLRHETDP